MRVINKLFILLLGLMIFSSCDKDFEEINTNPNESTAVPSGLLLADIIRVAQNNMYDTFVGGDMGSCWAQQIAKVQYNDEARYVPRPSVIQDLVWKGLWEDVVGDARAMYNLAVDEEDTAMQGVALVMQAYGLGILTDAFGMIPYTDALQSAESNFSPSYDSQEVVYDGILSLLDEANTHLAAGGSLSFPTSDLIYGGNVGNWQKFANSLKFRSLMRISAKRDVSAALTELMSRPMFTSNANEAKLDYLSAEPNANPIFERIIQGNRNEWKANEVLVNMLIENNDPRLAVYVGQNDEGEYRGKPSGLRDVPNDTYSYANVSPLGSAILNPNAPGYLMSYAQLSFLMAEAAQNGWIPADAATHYYNGIAASFGTQRTNLEETESYDLMGDYAAYISQGSVAYNGSLEQIGEQAWLALFPQGFESWTEWRRTGFPALSPALEGEIDQIPSRYTYPGIEQSVNQAAYQAAVAAQGPDLLTTKVWWMP